MTDPAQTPPATSNNPEPSATSAASAEAYPQTQAPLPPPAAPAAPPVDDDEVLIVDDEPAPAAAPAAPPAPAPAPVVEADLGKLTALTDKGDLASELTQVAVEVKQPKAVRGKKQKGNPLVRTITPVLYTIGLMLLVPAMWAVLILSGAEKIPGAQIDDAPMKAKFMLICWPVAILLLATAIYYTLQIMGEKDDAPPPRKRKVAGKA